MYVYQMFDGSWRLALYTSQRDKFAAIVRNPAVLRAYDAPYSSQRAAEKSRTWISAQTGIAF